MADKGKTVEETANGEVIAPTPFQMLVLKMSQLATMDETEMDYRGEDITPILTAESEAEMWDADERPTYNAKMLSGCEIQITGFEVKYGAGNNEEIRTPFVYDGRQMYLLIHSYRLNAAGEKKELRLPEIGEEFTWNTSARYIVPKMMWMLAAGWFDRDSTKAVQVRIQGTELSGGRSVEKLKPLQPVGVQAEAPF